MWEMPITNLPAAPFHRRNPMEVTILTIYVCLPAVISVAVFAMLICHLEEPDG
jgi:hypothetical protein